MNFEQLAVFRLQGGSHNDAKHGLCVMEAVAWLVGEPHTDRPTVVGQPFIHYARCLNDHMIDRERQQLVPYLPRFVDTNNSLYDEKRYEALRLGALRLIGPATLRIRGFKVSAETLENASLSEALTLLHAYNGRGMPTIEPRRYFSKPMLFPEYLPPMPMKTANDLKTSVALAISSESATDCDTIMLALENMLRSFEPCHIDHANGLAVEACTRYGELCERLGWNDPWQLPMSILDEMLAIGPSGGFKGDITPRVEKYRRLVDA